MARRSRPTPASRRRARAASSARSAGRRGAAGKAGAPPRRRAPRSASGAASRRSSSRLRRAAAGDRPYIVALLVLVILLGGMAAGPLQSFIAATDRVDTLTASRDQLRAEVDRLEERQVRLQDPEEIELLARQEQNLVMPGEVPYIVVTPEPEFARPEPGQGGAAESGEPESLWRRLADTVGGLFD